MARARALAYTCMPLSVLKTRVVNSLYPPTTLDLLCLKKEISRMTLRVQKEAKVADYDLSMIFLHEINHITIFIIINEDEMAIIKRFLTSR